MQGEHPDQDPNPVTNFRIRQKRVRLRIRSPESLMFTYYPQVGEGAAGPPNWI